MQIRVTAHRGLTVSAGACTRALYVHTRVQVRAFVMCTRDLCVRYNIYYTHAADSLGRLELREGIACQSEYTARKLVRAISSITSIYRCYLRGK